MFQVGAPYMTVYIEGPIQCSDPRTLNDLYYANGESRTAQTFLRRGPGNITVDVINVHAPSGKRTLTDEQRRKLITKLLQSASMSRPGQAIGSARFLIGGDMNTYPIALSRMLLECQDNGWLETQWRIHEPIFAMHGDLCVAGGVNDIMVTLTTKAMNHDPRHFPYGICWLESNKAIDQGSLKVLAESATEGCATRWPRRNRWTSGQATGSARCSIAGDTNTASSSGYGTKQPLEALPISAS